VWLKWTLGGAANKAVSRTPISTGRGGPPPRRRGSGKVGKPFAGGRAGVLPPRPGPYPPPPDRVHAVAGGGRVPGRTAGGTDATHRRPAPSSLEAWPVPFPIRPAAAPASPVPTARPAPAHPGLPQRRDGLLRRRGPPGDPRGADPSPESRIPCGAHHATLRPARPTWRTAPSVGWWRSGTRQSRSHDSNSIAFTTGRARTALPLDTPRQGLARRSCRGGSGRVPRVVHRRGGRFRGQACGRTCQPPARRPSATGRPRSPRPRRGATPGRAGAGPGLHT
jgi:hypothetical protein